MFYSIKILPFSSVFILVSIGCQDPILDGEAERQRSVLRQLCRSGPVCRRQSGAIGTEKELNQKTGQADKLAARGQFWRQADKSGGMLANLAAS